MQPWDDRWANAISGIESSGRYDLLGPVTKSGDRAYGKYQVMGANIPQWTKSALGRSMSPTEFLSDHDAQEAVFKSQFGSYVNKYGSPEEAASVWFSGRPMAQAGNAKDILGTTVPAYVSKFARLAGGSAPAVQAINTAAAPKGADVMPTTPAPDDGFMGQIGSFFNKLNYKNPDNGYSVTDAMDGVSRAMLALDNPAGSNALATSALVSQKSKPKPGDWHHDPKTGTFFRTSPQGALEFMKNPNQPEAVGPKLNASAMKTLTENMDKYGEIANISDEGSRVLQNLNSGLLDLNGFRNWENAGRNLVGMSNEQSRAYADYRQFLQKLANTELLKAKGVQTEGDAYRVMQEIVSGNANYDTKAAQEAITKLLLRNKEAVTQRGQAIFDAYKGMYGSDAAFAPLAQQFERYGSVYKNIDNLLEQQKAAQAPTASAPTQASGWKVMGVRPPK